MIRFLLTLALFTLLGPAISGLILNILVALWALGRLLVGENLSWVDLFNPEVHVILLIGGYFIGLVPLAVSGALIAWLRRKRPKQEPIWVALIGLIVGLTYSLWIVPLIGYPMAFGHGPYVNFSLTYALSALACWAILRRLERPHRMPA